MSLQEHEWDIFRNIKNSSFIPLWLLLLLLVLLIIWMLKKDNKREKKRAENGSSWRLSFAGDEDLFGMFVDWLFGRCLKGILGGSWKCLRDCGRIFFFEVEDVGKLCQVVKLKSFQELFDFLKLWLWVCFGQGSQKS